MYDYGDYITSNELYMIDVYNELGIGYQANVETLKNIQDVYLKLYFPKIKSEDVKSILDCMYCLNARGEWRRVLDLVTNSQSAIM